MFGLGKNKGPKPPKIIKDTKLNHGLRFSNDDVRWVVDPSKPIMIFGDETDRMLNKISNAITISEKQLTTYSEEDYGDSNETDKHQYRDMNKSLRDLMMKVSSEVQSSGFIVINDLAWAAEIAEDPAPNHSDLNTAGRIVKEIDPDTYAALNEIEYDLGTVTIATIALLYDNGSITIGDLMETYPSDVVMTVLTLASRSIDETASVYANRMRALEPAGKALGLILKSGLDYSGVSYNGEDKIMMNVLDGGNEDLIRSPFLLAVLHSCMNVGYGVIITVDSYDDAILPFIPLVSTRIMAGDPGKEDWLLGTEISEKSDDDDSIDLSGDVIISSVIYEGFMKIAHGVWPSPLMRMDRLNVDFI